MLRDVAMAFAFGTTAPVAAFMVAFRFAHLARRLFGEGSLQNTFIPHFEEFRKESKERAFAFFKDLSFSLVIILGALILPAMGILSFFPHKEILWYTLLMLPSLIFISLYGLNSALLACEKQYFIAGVAPVAFNVVWILAALSSKSMTVLSISVIFGCCAQWAVTVPFLKLPSGPKLTPFSPDVKKLLKPLLLANFGVAGSQINNALDPLFALFANSEGPAWLWYAIRVQQLPLALFGIALANALIPPISRAIKSGNLDQFHHFFQFAEKRVFTFTLLITTAIFATAPTCINLLFGRGLFGMASVTGSACCLLGYGIGLFPMTYVLIASPALFAFGDFKTPTQAALLAMFCNIGLNALFIFGLGLGATSVAFATSLSAFLNAHLLFRALQAHSSRKIDLSGGKTIVSICLFALSVTWLTDFLILGSIPALQLILGAPLELSQNIWDQIALFSAESLAFAASCLIFYRKWLYTSN